MASTISSTHWTKDPNSIMYAFRSEIFPYLNGVDLINSKRVSSAFYQAIGLRDQSISDHKALSQRFFAAHGFNTCLMSFREFLDDEGIVVSLPSGRVVSKVDFLEHPLFCNTKEKKGVFLKLRELLKKVDFSKKYNTFLSSIHNDNWFIQYEKKPNLLAYLSLVAFLDGEIDEEELFVVHTVSAAYSELQKKSKEKARVIKVTPKVISLKEELLHTLYEFQVPPFDKPQIMITNHKNKEDLQKLMFRLTEEYMQKSVLKRTFVTYTLSDFGSSRDSSIEAQIRFDIGCFSFSKDLGNRTGDIFLPPCALAWRLFCITSEFEETLPPPKPSFGHLNRPEVLYEGRPVFRPSALFKVKRPHDSDTGPAELGMYFHDLYHLLLEANNPHVDLFIKIGKRLLNKNLINKLNLDPKCLRKFAIEVLDREVNFYRSLPFKKAFDEFFKLKVAYYLIPKLWAKKSIIKYFREMFFPIIQESLAEYEKEKGSELMPSIDCSDPEAFFRKSLKLGKEEAIKVLKGMY